jgi:hypothetical protein
LKSSTAMTPPANCFWTPVKVRNAIVVVSSSC